MITYVLPTRNRPERLKDTLRALEALGDHAACGGAEVIVVDNDSVEIPILPRSLRSGLPLSLIRLSENLGAASRNEGARASDPRSEWIVMLDDDSYPTDADFTRRLLTMPRDVAAVSADIWLEQRGRSPFTRESGGLPEVFIGCGVAVRRDAFLDLGGYDRSFHYYVEEYDLAARMLIAGFRVHFDPDFVVMHAKDQQNRNMNLILSRLVRNNGWIAQRYAPEASRLPELREVRSRYRRIAEKERALTGFGTGLLELRSTLRSQRRTPMNLQAWDRFTGLAAARTALGEAYKRGRFASAAFVDQGKNSWVIAQALRELNVRVVGEGEDAEVMVIGTMSPGPMMDAYERRSLQSRNRPPHATHTPRVIAPWTYATQAEVPAAAAASTAA